MKVIKVNLKERTYSIIVGDNVIASFGKHLKGLGIGEYAYVVTTPVIKRLWGKELRDSLCSSGFNVKFQEVGGTEKSKSAKTCLDLLNKVAAYGRSRKVFIIAFGGGVVGDLSGFAASVYKRGIPYVQLPTTLVGQVDSAIGGKVAIDLKVGKNLIGSFYQPRLVFSEIRFLMTLPPKQIKNGLSEIIKYGVIKDRVLFEFLEKNLDDVLRLNKGPVEYLIERSSSIKASVVERDEFDKLGIRAVLNYGHTIGHAIEAASGYSSGYTHGMAVSVGMIAANFIARELKLIPGGVCGRIENLLKKADLPVGVKNISPDRIYDAHLYDKKFIHGKNRFVLPVKLGKAKLVEDIPDVLIRNAIKLVCKRGR